MADDTGRRVVGRYEVHEEIGRGMMGVVYRAVDPALGRRIALKTIEIALPISGQEREAFEKRFLAEARAAAALSHPGIVVVHDLGRDPNSGTLFIAFEYLDGRTLAQLSDGGRRLEWREALALTAQVAAALHHAHELGIVHRDIKPANVMVLGSGAVKLMDFGIARLPASQLTSTREFLGTPAYMSPEQLSGGSLDGRSDVFSLGAVLYLLLTGREAFQGGSIGETLARILHQDPVAPSRLVPGLPPGLDDVVAHALAKTPERRYSDARTFVEDLQRILAGAAPQHASGSASVPAKSSATGEEADRALLRSGPRVGRRRLLLLGGLVVTGTAAAFLIGTLPRGSWPSVPVLPPAPPPARLEVRLEHTLRSGTLRVWVDDALAVEEPLSSRVTEDLLVVQLRRGSAGREVEVAPGEHAVRVQVSGDRFSATRMVRGAFESGVTRRLQVEMGGLLKKELRVSWIAVSPRPNVEHAP